MPYPKKRVNRKKQGRKKFYGTAPSVAVGRGFQGDYTRPPAEKKFVDIPLASYGCDTTGSITLLNGIADGTLVTQRVGRKVTIRSVQVRGIVYGTDTQSTTGADTLSNLCRVMLVWDKQANGTVMTFAQPLSATTSVSFNNLDNRERFVMLMDKHLAMGPFVYNTTATQAIGLGDNVQATINKYKRMPKGACTIFSGTGATIGDITSGALYLVTIGSRGAANGHTLEDITPVRYPDA